MTDPSPNNDPAPAVDGAAGYRVLHLLGAEEDIGGVLTVVRQMQRSSPGVVHAALVHRSFVETRPSGLQWLRSRHLVMEGGMPRLLYSGLRSAFELGRHLREFRPAILHAHARGPLAAVMFSRAMGFRGHVVFTNHSFARHTGLYRRAAASRSITTVVLNPAMAAHYGLAPERGRVEIIPACCADSLFEGPTGAPPEPGRRLRLVGVGNLIRWKKWNLVLDALARLPAALRQRVHFTVWGPTPADADSRAFAAELQDMIGSLGLAPYARLAGPTNDVRAAMEAADVFVLPSTNEPCSVALAEALALGRPAIVSASGGNVDIVRPGVTGRLFRPDDPEDLARQIAGFAEGDWVAGTPEAIRESVRHHAATRVWAAYADLYRRLPGRAGAP